MRLRSPRWSSTFMCLYHLHLEHMGVLQRLPHNNSLTTVSGIIITSHWSCLWLCVYEPVPKLGSWKKPVSGAWKLVDFSWLKIPYWKAMWEIGPYWFWGVLKAHSALKLAHWTCCGKDLATFHKISLVDFPISEGKKKKEGKNKEINKEVWKETSWLMCCFQRKKLAK